MYSHRILVPISPIMPPPLLITTKYYGIAEVVDILKTKVYQRNFEKSPPPKYFFCNFKMNQSRHCLFFLIYSIIESERRDSNVEESKQNIYFEYSLRIKITFLLDSIPHLLYKE